MELNGALEALTSIRINERFHWMNLKRTLDFGELLVNFKELFSDQGDRDEEVATLWAAAFERYVRHGRQTERGSVVSLVLYDGNPVFRYFWRASLAGM